MDNLNKYRQVCFNYLLSRVKYFNEPSDELLDVTYRLIKGLPKKPVDDDQFNGLLGHKPVVEQRTTILNLLQKELDGKKLLAQDLHLDSIVRYMNKLNKRTSKVPYVDLFRIDNVELPKEKEEGPKFYKDLSKLHTSEAGINLMHKFEGYRECVYPDPGTGSTPFTGGFGSTRLNGKKLVMGQCYSKEVWEAQFKQDLIVFEDAVKRWVKVPLTQGMIDASVSWLYNCGIGAFITSTFLKRLNEGNYKGASIAMQWFNKAGGKTMQGLVNRRKAEAELFMKDI